MKILIPYDGSEPAKAAIADLSRAGLPENVEATVLSVADVWLPPNHASPAVQTESVAVARARAKASELLNDAKRRSGEGAAILKERFPNWNLAREAVADSPGWAVNTRPGAYDMAVIGARGQTTLSRLIFGSVSQKVVNESECSVRVGRRGQKEGGPVRVIVGTDGSLDGQAALSAVASRRWPLDSEILVLTSIDTNLSTAAASPGAPIAGWLKDEDESETNWVSRMLDEACEALRRPGISVSAKIIEGDPKVALLEEAEHIAADVIFVGARGHSLMERLMLGSVSSAVAIRAHCSVEIIRRKSAAV